MVVGANERITGVMLEACYLLISVVFIQLCFGETDSKGQAFFSWLLLSVWGCGVLFCFSGEANKRSRARGSTERFV